MEKEKLFQRVQQVFTKVFGPGITVGPETASDDINGWDSLNHVILIRELEKEFEVEIDLFDALELTGVGSVVDLIDSKINR